MRIILFCLMLISALSCTKDSNEPYEIIDPVEPVAKGDRLFGINISEGEKGFEAAFDKTRDINTGIVELNLPWSIIETSAGEYTDPMGVLTSSSFYAAYGVKVSFSLAVINTVKWEMPAYLEGKKVNSPEVIKAFTDMLDWFFLNIPVTLTVPSISIGNEVNYVLESQDDWDRYKEFYNAVIDHMHTFYPEIKVGVKSTIIGGLFGTDRERIIDLNEHSDVIMLNYYPQNNDFEVMDPQLVHEDFNTITGIFSGKEIWLTELGYQSGSNHCKSSEAKQAEFYHEMFSAWDDHRDKIKCVIVNWLHDQSDATMNEWKEYYGDAPDLVEYLSTLGLRNYDHSDKSAWLQVKAEAHARGWE